MKRRRTRSAPAQWAAMWHSENGLDGVDEHLIRDPIGIIKLFRSREEARDFIEKQYGYIRRRPDLKAEPHGWRIPRPVKLRVTMFGAEHSRVYRVKT